MFKNTGLLGQVDKFQSELKGKKADPGSLFFIEIDGLADHAYFGGGNLSDTAMNYLAHEAVAKISTAVTRLAGVGAKQFMVGNAFNWANLPGIVGTDFAKPMMVFQNRMNSRLPAEMDELAGRLNVKIIVFDFFTAGERIRSNANQYGITHLTDPCTTIPETRGEICATPDEYYYWGDVFLTRRGGASPQLDGPQETAEERDPVFLGHPAEDAVLLGPLDDFPGQHAHPLGPDEAGGHRVDVDVGRAQLHRRGPAETLQRGLAGGVVGHPEAGPAGPGGR